MIIKRIVRACFLILFLGLFCFIGAAQVEVVTHMEMQPDMIVGIALYPDGVTPVEELPVRVWSEVSHRVIYRTKTDKDGVFRVPKIDSGDCYVFVGRVRINLKIMLPDPDTAYQHNDIIIVIPRGMLITARTPVMDILIAPAVLAPIQAPKVVSP